MPYKIRRPTDYLKENVARNIMVYGPPGVGKTTLAAGANNPLFIATDPEGPISLLLRESTRNIPFVQVDDVKTMDDVCKDVVEGTNGMRDYETFVVDTISMDQTMDLIDLRDNAGNRAGKASMNEWGLTNQHISDRVFKLLKRKFPGRVIVIGHSKEIWTQIKGSSSGEKELTAIRPKLTPGAWDDIQGMFSGVYFYRLGPVVQKHQTRELWTSAQPIKAVTKDRYGLPSKLIDPKWTDIEDKIKERYTKIQGTLNG